MADLLLELFSEEIPARMQAQAFNALTDALKSHLREANLITAENGVNAAIDASPFIVTPRRLGILIKGLPVEQADATIEKKGPKTSAPQAAIDGFLKSNGLKMEQLEKRMVGKDEIYFATTHQKGQPTAAVLKTIIEKILTEFSWPKSMRWGSGTISWVRPLHSILCLFDGKVIPVEFAGIVASNVTYGHRFLSPGKITINDVDSYIPELKKAKVLADRFDRQNEILGQLKATAEKSGLALKEDFGLLEEVTGLVEWPAVLVGTIDAKYMDLPPEVLISEMRAHQKYFALQKADGSISDKFLITANMETKDGGKAIIAGNERVLRARLADGRFFWDQDRKKKLEDWAENLKTVTYHAKLGTIAEKVARIETLAASLAEKVKGADKASVACAAKLCKADLTTGMVGEFPDLQGVMGRYYALHQKENAAVADAIRDHYKPLGPTDSVPTEPTAICVALADKLDTLIGMFTIGEKPTGSKDPFALRRSALGIIRIILDNDIRLPLKPLLKTEELLAFFSDRLKVQLKDQGIRHDVISAVVASGDDDLVRIVARAQAVQAFLETDDGKNLLAGYRRAANIVAIEEKKDKKTYSYASLNVLLLKMPEERALTFLSDAKESDKLIQYMEKEQFTELMKWLSTLRTPFDNFFDKVMVNCDDEALRANRLSMLASIRDLMNQVADFSKIEG